jgi:hypothetical protein
MVCEFLQNGFYILGFGISDFLEFGGLEFWNFGILEFGGF